jgi:murein DD-endopeptidase MepM/ murein hydrolase activator NlpD
LRWLLIVFAAVLAGWGVWGAFYLGPEPSLALEMERPAIGAPTAISLAAGEPERGLGLIELALVQGANRIVLDRFEAPLPSPWKFWQSGTTAAELSARVGRGEPEWLEEGDATLRVTAARLSGPLRRGDPVVIERTVVVRLRPPSLSVLSGPLWVRQGGSGAIVFRAGDTAVRSGVVAGDVEFPSYPLPGSTAGERFVLFGVPWDLEDQSQVLLFAEDDAGNRAAKRAIDGFRERPARRDRINLSDGFLERVVPAIASQTPGLDGQGTLVEQYLEINGDLRVRGRALIAELGESSVPEFLWTGPFLQLPNSARKANFAEVRDYYYGGRKVDEQVHLGLDLASTARAPVPAANGGVVRYAGFLGIYGNTVVLDHGCGLTSVHAHLSAIAVQPGQKVGKGEPIGRTGATGLAGGDHLHLGFFIHGTAVDPFEWLDAKWIGDNLGDRLPLAGSQ